MRQLIIILGASLAVGFYEAGAQVPGASRQVDAVQQRRQLEQTARSYETGESAPELYAGENADVGPQSILKFKPRKTWFEAMADAQYFHTDNMFLNQHDKIGADVLVSTAQFALAPTPYELGGGRFAPRFGYRHEWFNFGLASDERVLAYDFQGQTFKQVR